MSQDFRAAFGLYRSINQQRKWSCRGCARNQYVNEEGYCADCIIHGINLPTTTPDKVTPYYVDVPTINYRPKVLFESIEKFEPLETTVKEVSFNLDSEGSNSVQPRSFWKAFIDFLLRVLFIRRKSKKLEIVLQSGISTEQLQEVLSKGKRAIDLMMIYCSHLNQSTVQRNFYEIADFTQKIFEVFKKNPRSIKLANRFLNYYLETTLKVMQQYIELKSQRLNSAELKSTITKAEALFREIRNGFEKQLTKLLENDLLDLNAEMSTLDQTIKMENF